MSTPIKEIPYRPEPTMPAAEAIRYLRNYQAWRKGDERTFDEAGLNATTLSDAIDAVLSAAERAESAEARVKELGEKYDEWARLYADQGASLRAVTEAGDILRNAAVMAMDENKDYPALDKAIARYDAARSADLPSAEPKDRPHICDLNRAMNGECFVCGSVDEKIAAAQREADERYAKDKSTDLPPHPDTPKPKCFGQNQCPEYGDYQKCPFAVECDNVICAARAQAGKEAQP